MGLMLVLKRSYFRKDGIFGQLHVNGEPMFDTLEYSLPAGGGVFEPVLPSGTYTCEKGMHRLKSGGPFLTYEVKGVKGHFGILFHAGNTMDDTTGCILLGLGLIPSTRAPWRIVHSRDAFAEFMRITQGRDTVELIVT